MFSKNYWTGRFDAFYTKIDNFKTVTTGVLTLLLLPTYILSTCWTEVSLVTYVKSFYFNKGPLCMKLWSVRRSYNYRRSNQVRVNIE